MAPAHPHATGVAVYPALLKKEGTLNMQFFTKILNLQSDMYISNFENMTLYGF